MRGSFSAVSWPIVARKYSFCSILNFFRDLQILHTSAPLEAQKMLKHDLESRQKCLQFDKNACRFIQNVYAIHCFVAPTSMKIYRNFTSHIARARATFGIIFVLQHVNCLFVQFKCFHVHINIFNQILKRNFRNFVENITTPCSFPKFCQ